jgi:biotin carboxylase
MPARYRIIAGDRLIYSVAYGVLSGADIVAHAFALRNDPEFDASFAQFLDFTHVTDVRITVEDIRRNSAISPFTPETLRVLHVPDEFVYAMGRMYQSHAEPQRGKILVTRDVDEAWEWLRPVIAADVRERCAPLFATMSENDDAPPAS